MDLIFERASLHVEVWSSPISTLAKKYGLSDNGLRKVCIALAIPLPGKGHWQKVAAGHEISTPLLVPTTGRTTFACRRPNENRSVELETSEKDWLAERLAFERDPQNAIVVESELVKPHRLVAAAIPAIRSQVASLQRSRDYDARPKKSGEPFRLRPMFKPDWLSYEKQGVMEPDEGSLPIRVSFEAADRALRIWDALLKACVARGMRVFAESRQVMVSQRGCSVNLRMSEKVDRITKGNPLGWRETVSRNPTGLLRIFVDHLGEKKFEETLARPLETQLNDILVHIYRMIALQPAREALAAENERIYAEAIAAREEEARREQIAEAAAVVERERKRSLAVEAAAWHEAQSIRSYVSHIVTAGAVSTSGTATVLREWAAWATAVADKLDPTQERLQQLAGGQGKKDVS